MRRLFLMISAGCIALGVVATTTLAAGAQTSGQQSSGDVSASQNSTPNDVEAQAAFISQGSAVGVDSAELDAVRADVAEEDRLPDYSQVVDNTTGGRFSAPGWQTRSDEQGVGYGQVSHGGSRAVSGSSSSPARFKVSIPTSNDYTVYAWWPAFSGSSDDASFGIGTASGTQWTNVDQTVDGGDWMKLGTYAMKEGERYIQLSAGSAETGSSVADAVAVVRGDVTMPPGEEGITASGGEATFSATSMRNPTRRDVVRVAKRYTGIRYRYATCTSYRMSCTCETKKTYKKFGHNLSMGEWRQWKNYRNGAKRVWHKRNLRRGDQVFFKENGYRGPITHVAIYSGNGNVVHASAYWGKVTESKMKYIRGYFGAKRYKLH